MKSLCFKKHAFTLAEVLITLGIIGIVAAMTLPNLVGHYRKKAVESKLKKFYSVMSQATRSSEAANGEFKYWSNRFTGYSNESMEAWWNKYYSPYIKTLSTDIESGKLWVYLADGTKLMIFNHRNDSVDENVAVSAIHLYFYPYANSKTNIMGKDYFTFYINSNRNKKSTAVEPYKYGWNGTREHLINGTYGCRKTVSFRHYCTALIQYNNWEIPDDYPYKF